MPRSATSRSGLPIRSLLESGDLPLEEISLLALREGQATSPLFRVHRWFARRLTSQFRSILTALSLPEGKPESFWERYSSHIVFDDLVIMDPFVGGGTSLVEASRCNARVIGFDIDPVATLITRFELDAPSFDSALISANASAALVRPRLSAFHKTNLKESGPLDVLHHFWVELRPCGRCGEEFEVHPHFQLAFDRPKAVQWVFCSACHATAELDLARKEFRCRCGTRTVIRAGTLRDRKVHCPRCRESEALAFRAEVPLSPPRWRLFAQEYLVPVQGGVDRKFKSATDEDRAMYARATRELSRIERREGVFAPARQIPERGGTDRRPIIHGFRRYRDLFNDRQLLHLTLLGKAIASLSDGDEKRLLAVAFSDHLTSNCMYAGYAFGYRRLSPLFAIHSYRHITRPVEVNPWLDGVGRGTFPNALRKMRKAVRFAKQPIDLLPDGRRTGPTTPVGTKDGVVVTDPDLLFKARARAVVRTQSSLDLSNVPDDSIDLILTDPPYFDNLSYSELSDFYLAWHQSLGIAEPPYDDKSRSAPIAGNLAVTSKGIDSLRAYRDDLAAILGECARTVRPEGVCVFTYHHKSAQAWLALGEALARSGLKCTAVVPMRGEGQGGLHSYTGTIKWDAVFVCRKSTGAEVHWMQPVVVRSNDVDAAGLRAAQLGIRLAATKRIGFREPDRLNLHRALVVSKATVGRPSRGRILLKDALDRT